MKNILLNSTFYLETAVIDENGAFVSGLTVTYSVRDSSDDSVFSSGTLVADGDAYKSAVLFNSLGQYRVFYTTPSGYENGMDQLLVVNELSDDNIYDYFTSSNREDVFKADVSSLATESNATSNKDAIVTEVNANEVKIDSIITSLSTIVSDIWSNTTRTLTSFGTIIVDIWNSATRTLTGIGSSGISSEANATTNKTAIIAEVDANEAKIDIIDTNVDSIIANPDNYKADVSALATSAEIAKLEVLINRILGLSQENYRIFSPTYNDDHMLTSSVVKTYESASDCDNDNSPIATYTMTAEYNTDKEMTTYRMVKN